MIHEDKIEFLDITWRPPAGGKRVKSRGDKAVVMAGLALARGKRPGETIRAKLDRITRNVPEVMVKVSGRQRGASHTLAHLDYVSRHGKLEIETSDGERLDTKPAIAALAEEWVDQEHRTTSRREPLTSVSMVLSMPPGHDPDRIFDAARAFARTELERFPYAMALHTDTDHPHVHLTVAARGEGGARFNPRKDDLARWREAFARELRARGIEAEATPRRARGQIRKSERTPVRKLAERAERSAAPKPRVDAMRSRQARAMAGEPVVTPREWETRAVQQHARVRADYRRAADLLEKSADPADKELAARTRKFVEAMPAPVTRTRAEALELARGQQRGGAAGDQTREHKPRNRERDG